uniref:CBM49 domain-containing protein n=1 Tax=Heterorhabditis bacteriophora TaxID=37862 RepID=A0A1I7XBA0_HETBA
MAFRTFLPCLIVQLVSSLCEESLLFSCEPCCAILFSAEDCSTSDTFRIKYNGNGILGAIWDDVPVAAVVRKGCLLELWDFKNQTGSHRSFGLDGLSVYPFDKYGFERRASSVRCTCVQRG